MDKEDLKFEIDQLRKDKIIYAAEACATVLVCILVFMFSNQYLPKNLKDPVNILVLVIGVSYTIFMGVGNSYRLQKIMKLQKKIRSNPK